MDNRLIFCAVMFCIVLIGAIGLTTAVVSYPNATTAKMESRK